MRFDPMRKISTISGPDSKKIGFIMSYIRYLRREHEKGRARKLPVPLLSVGKKISGWMF